MTSSANPSGAVGPGSVSRSMERGVRHEFPAQVQGFGAVDWHCSRPLVRSRPRQVGLARGQREGLRTATGVGRGGYRCPSKPNHGGSEMLACGSASSIRRRRCLACSSLYPDLGSLRSTSIQGLFALQHDGRARALRRALAKGQTRSIGAGAQALNRAESSLSGVRIIRGRLVV